MKFLISQNLEMLREVKKNIIFNTLDTQILYFLKMISKLLTTINENIGKYVACNLDYKQFSWLE